MRWGRFRSISVRPARPKAMRLSLEDQSTLLQRLSAEIERSPVLVGLSVEVYAARGRFYVERTTEDGRNQWGRITPLAQADELLLEGNRGSNKWFAIGRGNPAQVIAAIAGDAKGTFHGLGSIDALLREAASGLVRLDVALKDDTFVYVATGRGCTAQEVLFHYFGIPLDVLVEPRYWYARHRIPHIVDYSPDRREVLVRFRSSSFSGEPIVGTCLYVQRDQQAGPTEVSGASPAVWAAYTIRPSAAKNIEAATAWLIKRKWKRWC